MIPAGIRWNSRLRAVRWWLVAAALIGGVVFGARRLRLVAIEGRNAEVFGAGTEGRRALVVRAGVDPTGLPSFSPPRPIAPGDLVLLADGRGAEVAALPGSVLSSWRRPDGRDELRRDATLTGIILSGSSRDPRLGPIGPDEIVLRIGGPEPAFMLASPSDVAWRVLFLLGG